MQKNKKTNVERIKTLKYPAPKGVNKKNWKQKAKYYSNLSDQKADEAIALYEKAGTYHKQKNKAWYEKMYAQGLAKEKMSDKYYEKYWNTMYKYSNNSTFKHFRKVQENQLKQR